MTLLEILKTGRWYLSLLLVLMGVVYWRIVWEMAGQWWEDPNYSHGFIVPLISAYFVSQNWTKLKEALVQPWRPGLVLVLLALLQLLTGWLCTEYFTMRSSLVVLLVGLVLYLFGRRVFSVVRLPLFYLLFMVPIPYIVYDAVAFPLKLFVTRVSVTALKLLGVVVMREGNIIMFPATTLEVADACSGIRSLISLLALAVAYAFFIRSTPLRRTLLIVSAIPIAVATNALRVIITGILAQHWGARAAEGFFHEFAGLAVFALAMAMLVGLGALLRTREP